jgi:acyl CoA:acetate/3-ketoacid CoA transferase beta subunit
MVITELAVFENRNGRLILTEIAEGSSLDEVQKQTGFKITCAEKLGSF